MACCCLKAHVLLLPMNTAWALASAPSSVRTGRFIWPSARQNSHDWFRQQVDALWCRQASFSAGTREKSDTTRLETGLREAGRGGRHLFQQSRCNVHVPSLRRQVFKEKVPHINKMARKPCFHVQLPTSQPEALKEFLRHSTTYLCAYKWSWGLWETGWLWASVPRCLPLQPPIDWQLSVLLVPCIKGRSLEGSMLVLFFSVLYLAEPVCATSAVSASMKTALLIWEPIIIHRVSHKSEIIGILFLKAG